VILRTDFPLGNLTTFGVGGSADRFALVPARASAVTEAVAATGSEPWFLIGGGSNLLVSDSGFRGTVLRLETVGEPYLLYETTDCTAIRAGAASSWQGLVDFAVRAGLQGTELMSGIPGTIGGAIVQNAGAYGQSVEDILVDVTCLDVHTGEPVVFDLAECDLSYRSSRFKLEPGRFIILEATVKLERATTVQLGKRLAQALGTTQEELTLDAAARIIWDSRAAKDHIVSCTARSAGSFFRNLVNNDREVDNIFADRKAKLLSDGHSWAERWTARNADGQLIAGSLIGTSGELQFQPDHFRPGATIGHLRLGHSGSNTILNTGGATAEEILSLARRMQDAVEQVYGVILDPEVILVGDFLLAL
jgi:UDP-N-acetylmuramate dehydrogenase